MYEHQIDVLLQRTGSNICYKGHQYCITSLDSMLTSGCRHILITKDIYPVVARMHRTSPQNVERNIRTLIEICWNDGDREMIQRLCRRKQKPSNSIFLAGMYSCLSRQIGLAKGSEKPSSALAFARAHEKE